jgi:hypothetical protein
LDRRAGLKKFSDGVRVVAAGNHPDHSSVANLLPSPLVNRFAVIYVDDLDVFEWVEYVRNNEGGIDPRVAGYLARFPTDLYNKVDAETLENFPTPRSWSRLNQILRENDLGLVEVEEVARMLLGSVVAQKFAAFCKLQELLPPPDRILKDPDDFFRRASEFKGGGAPKIDLLYYAVSSISSHLATSKAIDWKQVVDFAVALAKVQSDLFVVFAKLLPHQMRQALIIRVAEVKVVQDAISPVLKYLR